LRAKAPKNWRDEQGSVKGAFFVSSLWTLPRNRASNLEQCLSLAVFPSIRNWRSALPLPPIVSRPGQCCDLHRALHFPEELIVNKVLKSLTIIAGLTLIALPALAYEEGDWILRGGVGMVEPSGTAYSDSESRIVVDSGTAAVFTGTYMMTPNWGFDILLATPFKHDIKVGLASGPTAKFAEVKHLPPTFSFQYHFMPDANFMPYAGFGANYTMFSSEKITDPDILEEVPGFSLSVDDTFGLAAQIGADWKLNEKWLLNFDIRYINIEPDVTVDDGVDVSTIKIDINPWVYSVSVGFIF
jgi:outer membrane protein